MPAATCTVSTGHEENRDMPDEREAHFFAFALCEMRIAAAFVFGVLGESLGIFSSW